MRPPFRSAAPEEERHLDGNHQAIPLRVGHLELREKSNAPRHTLVFRGALIAEENSARIASANQLPGCRINQVLMLARQLGTAHLAALHRRPLSGKLAQCRKRAYLFAWQAKTESSHSAPLDFRKRQRHPYPTVLPQQRNGLEVKAIQIHAAPGAHNIIVLTADGTRENCALRRAPSSGWPHPGQALLYAYKVSSSRQKRMSRPPTSSFRRVPEGIASRPNTSSHPT